MRPFKIYIDSRIRRVGTRGDMVGKRRYDVNLVQDFCISQ